MTTNSTAITKIKARWERAEFWLETASVLGGLMVGVGLWIEGETSIGQRLVTGGVAMEVICAWWVLVASRKLQNVLETEFETLRHETARANERAADANQKAERERLERVKIEQTLAWRSLTPKQMEAIASRLRPYRSDVPVPLFVSKMEGEIVGFANDLGRALQIANWPLTGGIKSYVGRAVVGVLIEFGKTASPADMERANATVEVFRSEGVRHVSGPRAAELGFFSSASTNDATDAPVQIIVGEKPRV